jgi:hypothetical protein
MLARDALMLYLAAHLGAAAEDVLAVWANHALTQDQAELVRLSCRALAEQRAVAKVVGGIILFGP